MYGMVNKAIEDLVVTNFGSEQWEAIKSKAGVDVDVFLSNESYPDKMTYDLVGAASEVLGIAASGILIAFGEHWVLNTARQGYGSMLEANGRTLPEFLINLPSFHTRVAMIFPDLQPPRFNCTDVLENSLVLHYYSHRPASPISWWACCKAWGKCLTRQQKFKSPSENLMEPIMMYFSSDGPIPHENDCG